MKIEIQGCTSFIFKTIIQLLKKFTIDVKNNEIEHK